MFTPIVALATAVVFTSLSSSVLSATQSHPFYHRFQPHRGPTPVGFSNEWYPRGVVHVDTEAETAWFDDSTTASAGTAQPKWTSVDELPFPQGVEGRVLYQVGVGEGQATVISVDSVRSGSKPLVFCALKFGYSSSQCILKHAATNKKFNETLSLTFLNDELLSTRYETNTIREGCEWKEGKGDDWVRGSGHDGPSMKVVIQRPVRPKEYVRNDSLSESRDLQLTTCPSHHLRPIFKPVDPAEPVIVGEDGKIVPPPPEKGFLAKYWMYILPVVVLLMMGGPDEQTGPPGTAGGK
ncbi:BQ2448_1020 [Microbotryum intermedium]|uniref:BQ2448_1020 protein n=1 Tax=Microbotryum intermedium TaxID=269621 RepID=A0A238F813_9BASI|nr:BQ2448_1020 [Microbotryum intermedium]